MRFYLLVSVFVLLASGVQAEQPESKLKAAQAELAESKKRASALKEDQTKLEQELETLQQKRIRLAEAARKREQRMVELEETKVTLDLQIKKATQSLASQKDDIAALIGSLIRLSQLPPEAVIAMPGNLRHTMQAASLLKTTTTQLQHQAVALKCQIAQLDRDNQQLDDTRQELNLAQEQLEKAQASLSAEETQRQKLFAKLNRQQVQEKQRIADLTQQSRSLEQLLARLEQQRKAREAAAAKLRAVPIAKPLPAAVAVLPSGKAEWKPTPRRALPTGQNFAALRGELGLPVAGSITERFGQKLHQNQTSRGLTIASRAGNTVTAPFGGEVVFTGPFLDYGQMVILRFEGGYHLLLAGLSEIQCNTGQRVAAGEPLGRLGSQKGGSLYLELRQNSKPVNPAPWFG